MKDTILELNNLTKTFILGNQKNARKAQKALQKLEARYERDSTGGDKQQIEAERERLQKSQQLFASEAFEASYYAATGKHLRPRPKDRGVAVHALNNVALKIYRGDLVAIMGPSGSGKSTLLNMLGLLDSPTTGDIHIKDQNVTSIRRRELPAIRSKELGFVFQSFNLVTTLTALENVMLPLRYARVPLRKRRAMATKALTQVGLGNRLNHKPNELSGGQQQRVAIARSIVNNPTIVFGDELTGELDSKMTTEVMDLVQKLNEAGQTFVIVTHNPEVAKRCKRVIYMKDGKVDKEATNTTLISS